LQRAGGREGHAHVPRGAGRGGQRALAHARRTGMHIFSVPDPVGSKIPQRQIRLIPFFKPKHEILREKVLHVKLFNSVHTNTHNFKNISFGPPKNYSLPSFKILQFKGRIRIPNSKSIKEVESVINNLGSGTLHFVMRRCQADVMDFLTGIL
jgi:hypothetical protein